MALFKRIQNSDRVQRWMSGRLPRTRGLTLTQRQIFIFLTGEGVLFAVLLLVTFIAGINYANNLVLGMSFFLGSVLIVTIHHTFAHLSGLQVEVVDASDSEVDGQSQYRIRLAPPGRRPHLQLRLSWQGQTQMIEVLAESKVISMTLQTPTRGKILPERLTISTVYPLGLLRAWTYVYFDQPIWVVPKPLANQLPSSRAHSSEDDAAAERVVGQDEFEELREFVAGESMARISWRHLARGQGLLSKQFSDARGREQLLDYGQMAGPDHESRLSQMAYWVQRLDQAQVAYALRLPSAQLEVGLGAIHRQRALRLLAEQP